MNTGVLEHIQTNKSGKYSKNPQKLLEWIAKNLPNKKVIMGTGFGPPGIVLLDILFKVTREISVFYVDTNFLFDQTYELKNKLEKKYNFTFLKFASDLTPAMQSKQYGDKLWEKDPDACCNLRKVLPLKEALEDYDAATQKKRKNAWIWALGCCQLVHIFFEPRKNHSSCSCLQNTCNDNV